MPIFFPCGGVAMGISKEFDRYMAHLAEGLGHADRHAGLSGYCTGLMLPLSRKSIEPMAALLERVEFIHKLALPIERGAGVAQRKQPQLVGPHAAREAVEQARLQDLLDVHQDLGQC